MSQSVSKCFHIMRNLVKMSSKFSYFQGTEEPTPKKKQYKSDPTEHSQPRFKEPLFRNYDIYDTPGEHGPGAGWHSMQNYKSISEFLAARRKKLKDKYKEPKKSKARLNILSKLIKVAIDFPIDDQVTPILGDSGSYSDSAPIGILDNTLPLNDFEGKSVDQLDFGRDYTQDEIADEKLNDLEDKYISPAQPSLYGLPDGILPKEDLDAPSDEKPFHGITDSGNTTYKNLSY